MLRRLLDLTYPSYRNLKVLVKGPREETVYEIRRTEARFLIEKQDIL